MGMSVWRPAVAVVAGTLLLAGCTGEARNASDPKETSEQPTVDASAGGAPSPSASPADEPYTVADDMAPRTRAEALAFVRRLAVRPDYFGAGFRKSEPYESDPAEWAVLGEDCVWRREPLPYDVLASLTRRFALPEAEGKGPVQVSLTVTVHEDDLAARRDMAESLEGALRCPEQRLNATGRVRGLFSRADHFTEQRNAISDDNLTESGTYVVDGEQDAHPFAWFKHRLGPVTVAATCRVGAGRTEEEATTVSSDIGKGVGFVAADIDRQAADDAAGKSEDRTPGTDDAGGTESAR
ncbi:hypothetical protein ADL00_34490 [Streptomyces sp. AS58]|nr:hypothetical protein ADL00_34490 [Streptomyces sp. AS58]